VGRSVVETAGLIALGAVAVSAVYWLVQLVQAL